MVGSSGVSIRSAAIIAERGGGVLLERPAAWRRIRGGAGGRRQVSAGARREMADGRQIASGRREMGEVIELRIYGPGRTLRVLLGHATMGKAWGQHRLARMVGSI
jgi:hypothetical protein